MLQILPSEQLIYHIKKGEVALFLSHRVSELAGAKSWVELTKELVQRANASDETDPSIIMQCYQKVAGKPALYDHLLNNLSDLEPNDIHLEIAGLPIKTVFTTAIDHIMEKAYERIGKRIRKVVIGIDLPYTSENEITLIKLYGDIDRPESLILTRYQKSIYFEQNRLLIDELRRQLVTKTFLFLGAELRDVEFRHIFDSISYQLKENTRRSFAVSFNSKLFDKVDLEDRNIALFDIPAVNLSIKRSALLNFVKALPNRSDQPVIKEDSNAKPVQLLAGEVMGLLKAMGHTFEIIVSEGSNVAFVATRKTNGTLHRRYYKCYDAAIGSAEVRRVIDEVNEKGEDISTCWLITYKERFISPQARQILQNNPRVKAQSVANFYKKMVSFDDHLLQVWQTYSASLQNEYYVKLACDVLQYDEKRAKIIGKDTYDLEDYIDAWLQSPGQNHISLLGDFGSGKTWFCQNYVAKLANRYLNNPDNARIPILIPLKSFKNISNIEDLITTVLVNQYGIDLPGGFSAFSHLNRYDHLLLVFDGFDEMTKRSDYDVVVKNFEEIAKVVVPNTQCKVILTSRTSYFRSNLEVRQIFSANGLFIDLKDRPNFDVLHIRNLEENKIVEALKKRRPNDWESIWKRIENIYDLKNLAERPVLLEMIVESLSELEQLEFINVTSLYDSYTRDWVRRQHEEGRTLVLPEEKLLLMQELAWKMYERNEFSIHHTAIIESIGSVAKGLYGDTESSTYGSTYDVQSQSLLIRDELGYYTFAHQSFVDFFVAKKLVADILMGNYERFGREYISEEVYYFMDELVQTPSSKATLIKWVGDKEAPITVRRNGMAFLTNSLDQETQKKLIEIYKNENELSISIRIAVAFHKAGVDSLLDDLSQRILEFDTKSELKETKSLKHSLSLQRSQNLKIDNELFLERLSNALALIQNEHIKRTIILVLGKSRYKNAVESLEFVLKRTHDSRSIRYAINALEQIGVKESVETIEPFLGHDETIIRQDAKRAIDSLQKRETGTAL